MKKLLVKFDFGLYYAFGQTLEILTEEEYKKVLDFSDSKKEIYLGEIEGKHSEVYGPLDRKDISIISENNEDIEVFERLFPRGFGAFDMVEAIQEALDEG